jgi:hypothetical protein
MWDRRLAEPVVLDNGEVLRTLRDARKYILALPEQHQQYAKWRRLAALITAPLPTQLVAGNLQKNRRRRA